MYDKKIEKVAAVVAYIVTALILFAPPFVIGLIVGHLFW